ncbi:A/G-specific adenine glycosylase [Rubripirellula reticaptiva]|nr:A/G-specific adenine glycosylase [Rubripirellula reticaptiva]
MLDPLPESLPDHDPNWTDTRWRRSVRTGLLKWFAANARTLPWRSEPTPYRVWVSEIMLQQTQVATVLPYFDRFMQTFPNVATLAAADEQSLMQHWEGLGYYRRARSMHTAAAKIVADHDGEFPESFDDVLALPGIGRYTAGAILSISRDQRHPILEGNTVRVFSRWIALRSPATAKPANKLLWQVAEAMLPAKRSSETAGTFNQAAMELGALVCTPKSPKCNQCPVAKRCEANTLNLQTEIPGKVTQIKYQDRTEFAFVIAQTENQKRKSDPLGTKYLVRPIPPGSRWAGLWDFPRTIERSIESPIEAAGELTAALGEPIVPGERLTTIKHAVTKYRIKLNVHTADWGPTSTAPPGPPPEPWRYVTLAEMANLPMSVTGRKIAKLLG